MKKVQANKAEALKLEEIEKRLLEASLKELAVATSTPSVTPATSVTTNVLSGFDAADDDDVVFK